MKTEHTPEPWATNGTRIESEHSHGWANDGWIIAGLEGPDAEANARRIVACVNTCAGLPTEVLERYKLGVIGVEYKSTKQQRDELLAALERSLESFEYIAKYGNSCGHSQLRIPDLKAVIASVEEK